MNLRNKISAFLILLSIALWAASLFFPVFIGSGQEPKTVTGAFVFIMGSCFGWIIGITDIGYFAVYANYFWMAALVVYRFRKQTEIQFIRWLVAVMWILALLTFSLDSVYNSSASFKIFAYGTGLYLWFAALFCATSGTVLSRGWRAPPPKPTD